MAPLKVLEFVRHEDGVWNLPQAALLEVAARFPGVEFVSPGTQAEADRMLPEADVVLGWAVTPHNFALARRLRWIHLTAAGVGSQLFPGLVASDVVVTNARGIHAVSMAEHAIAMLLSFARKLHLSRDAQREDRWRHRELWSEPPEFRSLQGSALGIVGLGAVGSAIATRAAALGMTVRAVTRTPRRDPAPASEVWTPNRLGDLAAASDWLVLVAPGTAATQGMVGRAVLERMPRHAVLVNLGRGALVDEAVLIERLESGDLAGAALDVFAQEPLPATSPLWRLPQVLLTPHTSGLGPHYWARSMELFAANLRAHLDGHPYVHVVDKREGY